MNKFLLVFVLFFTFCGTSKKNIGEQPISDIPFWVKNYPVSENYYIGIGIADKSSNPENFIQIAQQNALQNLSNQIKVTIATESIFLQMEREYGFEEEFKSNINIKANEYLEGYELEGTYTNQNEYWVYYKLSKEKHLEIQNARKFEAVELAKSHLEKAYDSYTSVSERYIHFVSALNAIRNYLSEPLITEFDRKKIFLGNEIISSFRSFVDDFKILYKGEKIKVMIGDAVGNIKINVSHKNEPIDKLDLVVYSEILKVERFNKTTDDNGNFIVTIPKISSTDKIQKIDVGINYDDWINQSTNDDFIKKMIKSVKTHQIKIPIYVYTPNIYVKSIEKDFGKEKKNPDLKFAAESALTSLGFTPVAQKKNSDMTMIIESNTEKGQAINGQKMFTAYLNLNLQVKDHNGMIVFSDQINKLKGIQLDFEQANSDAYNRAKQEINNSLIPNFVNSFVK